MKLQASFSRSLMFFLLGAHLLCCRTSATVEELEKYIQNSENNLKQCYEKDGLKAYLIYKPTDLIVWQEQKVQQQDIEQLKKKYESYYYFVLNLQQGKKDLLNATISDKSLFASVNEQLSFQLHEHVYALDDNNDTSRLVDFAFPRLYEAARATSILLVFKSDDFKTEDFKICIKDIAYTIGTLEFRFNKKHLTNIPTLKLS